MWCAWLLLKAQQPNNVGSQTQFLHMYAPASLIQYKDYKK